MATSNTSYELDADGTKIIPASQRPDGTWRKPRRVRDGYVPQDEVPLYESKGKHFAARQTTGLPVGLPPEFAAAAQKPKKNNSLVEAIPGFIIDVDKTKKKKKKTGADKAAEKLAKCEIREPNFVVPTPANKPAANTAPSQAEPAKRLKNLRKKLRDIEALEEKLKSGLLKSLNEDQKEKLSKKAEVLKEIDDLEKEGVV